jgi:hypothetical protein
VPAAGGGDIALALWIAATSAKEEDAFRRIVAALAKQSPTVAAAIGLTS